MSRRRGDNLEIRRLKGQRRVDELDRSWMIYAQCWLCGREFCVNNYADHKARPKRNELAGKLLCGSCKTTPHSRRFLQMYMVLSRSANCACEGDDYEDIDGQVFRVTRSDCKCIPCITTRLFKEIEGERPRRRFYRKARKTGEA